MFYYVIWYVGYGYFYIIYDTFWNRSKKFDFIVKHFLENECSIALKTLDKIKYGFVEKDLSSMHHNVFWSTSKNKQEAYEKLIEMSRNDEYTTGNLFDYYQKYYKVIAIDLSRQTNTSIPQ